jgi:hypothetical protein
VLCGIALIPAMLIRNDGSASDDGVVQSELQLSESIATPVSEYEREPRG